MVSRAGDAQILCILSENQKSFIHAQGILLVHDLLFVSLCLWRSLDYNSFFWIIIFIYFNRFFVWFSFPSLWRFPLLFILAAIYSFIYSGIYFIYSNTYLLLLETKRPLVPQSFPLVTTYFWSNTFFLSDFPFTDTNFSQEREGGDHFYFPLPLPSIFKHSQNYLQLCI